MKDFAPVSLLAAGSFMLAAHPSVPAKSVKELIAFTRARPGELNVAVSGAGIVLAAELFASMARVKMTKVSYKGSPQGVTALVSGEVSVGFPSTSVAMPHLKSGRLTGLAVTSAQRSPVAPVAPDDGRSRPAGLRGDSLVRTGGARGHAAGNRCAPARRVGEAH